MKPDRMFLMVALAPLCLVTVLYWHPKAESLNDDSTVMSSTVEANSSLSGDERAAPQDLQDFTTRCHGEGVLACVGFDSPQEFVPARDPDSGLYPAGDGVFRGTLDTAIAASGGGSLKFTIPSYSGPNTSGYWKQAMGKNFGEGSTFYVQFRQRFSQAMLTNTWGGNTYWKQVIFHNGPHTCADVELATTKSNRRDGYPVMYSQCGSDGMTVDLHNGDFLVEQGDYNCHYHDINPRDCFMYLADIWITFYYKTSIGHWGKPDSTIQAWVALPGKPYKQWVNMPNHRLLNASPGRDYDTVTLLPYMTAKDPTQFGGPVAYTWYDELIVSTQPIPPAK
jgi:hypothetical protein